MKTILKEENKPTGDGWFKIKNKTASIDTNKYEVSPGGEWMREKPSSSSSQEDKVNTGEKIDVNKEWQDFKEELKKLKDINPEWVLSRGGNIVSHIYNMGKSGLKQVKGDLMSVINSIPSPGTTEVKKVENLSLQEVMSDGIELTEGNVGKNVTELHKLLKKMGQTIDKTEYDQKLFGSTTQTAIKNLQNQLEEPETGTLTSEFYDALIQNQNIESKKKKEEEKNPYREVQSYSIYENKELMTEEETQVSLDEQKKFLKECLDLGCFKSFIDTYKLEGTPEFKKFANNNVYILFKGENKKYAFTYDFNIYSAALDSYDYQSEDQKWKCPKFYCNTPERKNWVNTLMSKNPETYTFKPISDQSTKIDLSDTTIKTPTQQPVGSKNIFPRKGMCFIFQKSLSQGTSESVINDLETKLNQAGFTFNVPALSWMKFVSFSVEDILGKSLTQDDRNRFKNELSIKVYPKQDSEMVKLAAESNKLFGRDCQGIYQTLYNAIQNPDTNDYTKDNDGYTKLMQDKIFAYRCSRNKDSMKFCNKQRNIDICKSVRWVDSPFSIRELVKSGEMNEGTLSKTIKEHLIKLSKNKKKSLLEKRIVERRFKVLVENKNPKKTQDITKFVQEAYDEMTYLSNQKYETSLISESLFDMMKLFVGPTGEQSVKKTFKQYVTNNLIQKLTPNKPNGYLAKIIEKTISELDLKDAPKLTDCHFVSEILTQSILKQIMIQKQKSEKSIENPLDELVKDSIFDSLYESNIQERLSTGISNYICPRLNKIQSNLDNKFIQSKNRIF